MRNVLVNAALALLYQGLQHPEPAAIDPVPGSMGRDKVCHLYREGCSVVKRVGSAR